jgi:gamma-glutamylcyclotransferase
MTIKPGKILYFAYGSNLNKKLMKERLPESKPTLTAVLPHYRLAFLGWSRQWKGGTVTIRTSHGDKVTGGVYEIPEKDLPRLDGFEGYPRESNRINVTVFTEDGEALKAVTYIRVSQAEETKPSMEYLTTIKQGYRDWGIV